MPTISIFDTLCGRDALLEVSKNELHVLKPHNTIRAIGARELNRGAFLVLAGTTPGSAIAVVHIDGSHPGAGLPGDATAGSSSVPSRMLHYMEVLRKAVSGFLAEPDFFQMPLAWVIFGRHEDGTAIREFQEKTANVFKHLNVRLHVSGGSSAKSLLLQRGNSSIVAVRHGDQAMEIYIGDDLVYPEVHSGSLALVLHDLGAQQR